VIVESQTLQSNVAPVGRRLARTSQALVFFCLLFGMYVIQSAQFYSHPAMVGKDGAQIYPIFYGGDQPISRIYLKPQGYFSFIMYSVPWALSGLSTALQPFLYTLSATAIFAAPMAFLFWSNLFKSWGTRTLISVLIAFWYYWEKREFDAGTFFVAVSMSFWPACLLYFLIVLQLYAERRSAVMSCLLTAGAIPFLFCHPYTIAATPLLGVLIVLRSPRVTKACALILILLSGLYVWTHDESKTNLWLFLKAETILDFIQYMFNSIFLLGVVSFSREISVFAAVTVAAVVCGWLVFRPQAVRSFSMRDVFIIVFIFGISALYFASYRYEQYGSATVPLRYGFVQQVLWLIFVARRLERIRLPLRLESARPAIGVLGVCGLLVARGLGTPSGFAAMNDPKMTDYYGEIRYEMFSAMEHLESIVARYPDVAFIVFVPEHSNPTRSYFIGDPAAVDVMNFNFTARDELLEKIRKRVGDDERLDDIRAAHLLYGVGSNLVQNGDFRVWIEGAPLGWQVERQGKTAVTSVLLNKFISTVALSGYEPGSIAKISQVINSLSIKPGTRVRFALQTLRSEMSSLKVTLAVYSEGRWRPVAEFERETTQSWRRLEWEGAIPDDADEGTVLISISASAGESSGWANATNCLLTVSEPVAEQ